MSVSGSGKWTFSTATPSSSAAIMRIESHAPCPISAVAQCTIYVPSSLASTAIEARLGVCMPFINTHSPLPRASRVDPHVRDAIRTGSRETHLLCYPRSTIGVRSSINPALDLLGNQCAIPQRPDLDAHGGGMPVQRQPLFATLKDDLDGSPGFTRQT